jgi:hypothetical protein
MTPTPEERKAAEKAAEKIGDVVPGAQYEYPREEVIEIIASAITEAVERERLKNAWIATAFGILKREMEDILNDDHTILAVVSARERLFPWMSEGMESRVCDCADGGVGPGGDQTCSVCLGFIIDRHNRESNP